MTNEAEAAGIHRDRHRSDLIIRMKLGHSCYPNKNKESRPSDSLFRNNFIDTQPVLCNKLHNLIIS